MRLIRSSVLVVFSILILASCGRDPNVAKQRYLESGNKYFEKQRYKEAVIQYRNALKLDPRFGPAHYRLALAFLKSQPPRLGEALKELRRSLELLEGKPESFDSRVKLAEIYLSPASPRTKEILADAEKYCKDLLDRDANSFDGLRLTGDLNYVRAIEAAKAKDSDEAKKKLAEAIAYYHKAEAVKAGDEGVLLMLGRGMALSGDAAASESYYRQALVKYKTNMEAYRELYAMLWAQGKKADAEQLLRTGFKENPKQFAFLIWIAQQYLAQNRRDDMVKVLNDIKSKAGEYGRAYMDVGDFYLRTGDGDAAVREYKEGISKDSKNKSTYQKRIVEVLMRQSRRNEAADMNAQILKDNPNDADARGVAATLLLDKGDVTKAILELQRVVSQAPDNPVARYNLGRAYFMRGDAEQARQQFLKAIEIRPDYLLARMELGRLLIARGDYDVALRTAEEILKMDPNNSAAKLIYSAALMGQRRYGDSRRILEETLKANPTDSQVVFQMAVVDLADGKYKDAEASFRKAYQMTPANTKGLMGVVETYLSQNKVDEALKLLQEEAAKAPTRMDFPTAIANVAIRAGRLDLAINQFQKVLANTPKGSKDYGEANLRIGETYRRKGDFTAAINSLQTARQTLPEDVRVLSTMALTFDMASRWAEAKQVYEAALKVDPSNGSVLNNLAYLLVEHGGDVEQALTYALRAKQALPDMGEITDTLAWIYLKKNIPDKAIEVLTPIIEKNPNQATWRFHLGLAFAQKGDKTRAQAEFQRALSSGASKEEKDKIQDSLARLK
jgi:tetratricopeptide (TPR) repeat protein